MKITTLADFLTLPEETVFSIPCNMDKDTGPLCIKGKNLGENNFEYSYLVGFQEPVIIVLEFLRTSPNESIPVEPCIPARDDFWFDNMEFLVYDYCDLEEMMITLTHSLEVADT